MLIEMRAADTGIVEETFTLAEMMQDRASFREYWGERVARLLAALTYGHIYQCGGGAAPVWHLQRVGAKSQHVVSDW